MIANFFIKLDHTLKHILSKGFSFHELFKSSLINFFFRVLGLVLNYIFTIAITRNFGAETFGYYNLAFVFLQFAVMLNLFGLDSTALKFISEYTSSPDSNKKVSVFYKKVFLFTTIFGLLITFFSYGLADYLAVAIFDKPEVAEHIQIISLAILPLALIKVNTNVLLGLKKVVQYSFLHNASIPAGAIIIILILYNNTEQFIPTISYSIATSVTAIISFILIALYGRISVKKGEGIKFKKIIGTSYNMFLSSSALFIAGWVDIIMLGIFSDAEALGIYGAASKVARVAILFIVSIGVISAREFAAHHANKNIQELKKSIYNASRLAFMFTTPLIVFLFVFMDPVLGLFGEEFKEAKLCLAVLLISQYFNALTGPTDQILNMTDNQAILKNINFISIISNIGLNFILIPHYGILGAAIATGASNIFMNLSCTFYIWKRLDIISFYLPFFKKSHF